MIKKVLLLSCCSLMLAHAAMAADEHYLRASDVADSLALLPPPPSYASVDFLRDKAHYDEGMALRKTPRGQQAYDDADLSKNSLAQNFASAFGYPLSEAKTPQTLRLMATMKEDAGDFATRSAKQTYKRIRPFAFFKQPSCRPEDEKKLASNGSYPSGHTTIGWAVALVLAEVKPARQNEILKRGYEMGQSRVICGYHWQSDVDAGRIVGSAVVARLHDNPAFIAQLALAKREIAALH